jgi:O-antigen/teichoic acid export membrane protein
VSWVKSVSKAYLGLRAITSLSSLVFAFSYSQSLGVENRSVIAFAMTTNSLAWVVITSGTTLTLRKMKPNVLDQRRLNSFFTLYAIEIVASLVLFAMLIFFYSVVKSALPLNLVVGILLYFFMSGLHLLSVELLLAFDHFKLSGLLDVTSIFMQIGIFVVFQVTNLLSVANSLLACFSITYGIIFLTSFGYLKWRRGLQIRFYNPRYFLIQTKGHHSLGISLGIMDRLDRILIGFMLPINVLGRYAVMSGMLSFFRFIPDSISKLVISNRLTTLPFVPKNKYIRILIVLVLALTVSTTSYQLIKFSLGIAWLLPIGVTVMFFLQESMRSAYQVIANRCILIGLSQSVHRQAILVPIISIALAFLTVPRIGIYGVSVSISIAFVFSAITLWKFSNHD